jgi:hypothetical protein
MLTGELEVIYKHSIFSVLKENEDYLSRYLCYNEYLFLL